MLGLKWKRQVPVYLFTGFLDSGKTSFLNDSLKEDDFTAGERNLCIICEEGEVEMDPAFKKDKLIIEEYMEEESSLSREYLQVLNDKHKPEKVLVECNGMWQMESFYRNLPENWIIVQEMSFYDSSTFMMFNNNMRNLVYDKLRFADMVIFNRFDESIHDVEEFHKTVRVANRSAQIIYELKDGTIKVDEIEDPLPFDIQADYIDLDMKDYAYWYQHIMEEPEAYDGKKMTLSGVIKKKGIQEEDRFIIGRPLMTCCEEDIQFTGTRCINRSEREPMHNKWAKVTGTFKMGKSMKEEGPVPILVVEFMEYSEMPENTLAMFL